VVGCVYVSVTDEVAGWDVDEVIVKECKNQALRFYVTCVRRMFITDTNHGVTNMTQKTTNPTTIIPMVLGNDLYYQVTTTENGENVVRYYAESKMPKELLS